MTRPTDVYTFKFRPRGLPKFLSRIKGGIPGYRSGCAIDIIVGHPAAKVMVFKDNKSMRNFHQNILSRYIDGQKIPKAERLNRRTQGCVMKLLDETITHDEATDTYHHECRCDRNYFCLVMLVEGHLNAEVLCHEACHVGFAWDFRTDGKSKFSKMGNAEENICYPAGIFLDNVLSFIKDEKLREV